MEPPAVSVGLGYQRGSSRLVFCTTPLAELPVFSLEKSRRDLMLRIDPQITYASTSHAFEELPENFLETISPQQTSTCALEINTNHLQNEFGSSCLSPGIGHHRLLFQFNWSLITRVSGLATKMSTFYRASTVPDCCNIRYSLQMSNQQFRVGSGVDDLGHESRRSTYIIKEESPDVYHNSGPCETIYLPSSFEHDDGDMCNMHSPISLQNDLVTSVLSSEEVGKLVNLFDP